MDALKWIGGILLVTWFVLWLVVKITFTAIHLLLLVGLAMVVWGLLKSRFRRSHGRDTAG